MVLMLLVRTFIKTGNPHFFKRCQIWSELLQFMGRFYQFLLVNLAMPSAGFGPCSSWKCDREAKI